jgi:AcrR family transcriptional regulator
MADETGAQATRDAAPRQRDAERTQRAILAAAIAEFHHHGLGGARVDRIAESVGVNKKLIFYYFKNKERLFQAALEDIYRQIRQAEERLHLNDLPPTEAVRKLTEFTWNYYLAHPEFLTLLNSENLHKGRHLVDADNIGRLNSPLIETLGDMLEKGRREGLFRGGVDAVQLYISIAALCYFYLSNNATLSIAFSRDLRSKKALNERLLHVTDMVLGYLLRN